MMPIANMPMSAIFFRVGRLSLYRKGIGSASMTTSVKMFIIPIAK